MRYFKKALCFLGVLLPVALSACQGGGSPVSEEEGGVATFGAVTGGAVTVTLSDKACGSAGLSDCGIDVEVDDSPVFEEVSAADYHDESGGEIDFKLTGSTLEPVIPSTIKVLTKAGTDSASPTALNAGSTLRVTVSRPNGEAVVYEGKLSDASTPVMGVLFSSGITNRIFE